LKAASQRLLCSLPVIVIAAFLIRLAFYVPMVDETYRKVVIDFPYGAETGQVAAAIAQGRGFSSPLRMVQTGPTAWFAPIFPYLLGGIFKIFGVYSYTSNLAIHFFDLAFAAFTCWPLAFIAGSAFGKKAGIAAAWTWVFLPCSWITPNAGSPFERMLPSICDSIPRGPILRTLPVWSIPCQRVSWQT